MTTLDAPAAIATLDRAAFAREWEDWHRAHEARRADPHGFLAVTAIHWLDATPTRFDGIPGTWSTDAAGPVVELAAGEALEAADGTRLAGRHAFGPIAERGGVVVRSGDVAVEVARRGGRDIVRPRDPAHPYLTRFTGTPTYLPNPRWIARGRFIPDETPREVTVGSAAEGLQHVYEDATSGLTTYAANRSLEIDAPDADGAVVLDFNRAVNLPCAYTDHATCPLPPAGNRLPVGIEAGEKTPIERNVA